MEETRPTAFTPLNTARRTGSGRLILIAIIGGALIFIVIVTVVLAVVIPRHISYLEYYEYGLKREKDTGLVSLDKVYTGGRHWLGEDYDFLVFRTHAYHVNLENITTYTKEKLQVMWNVHMQFFLRKDELTDLYKNFSTTFFDEIEATAIDTLKSVTAAYSIRELTDIEEELHLALRQSVGGKCCRPGCNQTGYPLACFKGCVPREVCAEQDKGIHADIKFVQMGVVNMPEDILARMRKTLILQEEVIQEKFLQEAIVIRKETDMEVQHIRKETQSILDTAKEKGDAAIDGAKTEYIDVLERVLIEKLQNSIKQFNISDEEKTAGLVYLHTLIAQRQFRPNITFIRQD